jgi:hypothetical protein
MFGPETVEFDGDVYNARHGGAFDRGSADSYYGRPRKPHYFEGATYQSVEIQPKDTEVEYWEYLAGYDYNEQFGDKKVWD